MEGKGTKTGREAERQREREGLREIRLSTKWWLAVKREFYISYTHTVFT